MALKTKVKRESVVSEEDGNVEWITDSGKMMKAPAKDVEIIEAEAAAPAETTEEATPEPEAQAEEQEEAPPPAASKPKKEKAPPKAKQAAKAPAKLAKAAAPTPAKPAPKPPQAEKPAKPETKENTVATAKAKKKSTAKGARTIGGKEVDLSNYNKVKAPGGGVSYNNGDATAKKLEGKSLDDVYKIVARDTKQDEKELRKKYAHLNPGMQRMALGNMHRKGPRDAKKDKKAA
jgi:outer membrane biosynthesis protein TonB